MLSPFYPEPRCEHCSLGPFCLSAKEEHLVTKRHHLKKKAVLHGPHTKFIGFYALQSGALKLYDVMEDGRETIHRFYFQNEVYGFEALVNQEYPFYTEAMVDSVLCEIPYSAFLQLLDKKPYLRENTLFLLAHQLSTSSYLTLPHAQDKVFAFLTSLKHRLHGSESIDTFKLPLSYADMGKYLGLATETVSRILLALKKKGVIDIKNKYISI